MTIRTCARLTPASPNHYDTTSRRSFSAAPDVPHTFARHKSQPLKTKASENHFVSMNSVAYGRQLANPSSIARFSRTSAPSATSESPCGMSASPMSNGCPSPAAFGRSKTSTTPSNLFSASSPTKIRVRQLSLTEAALRYQERVVTKSNHNNLVASARRSTSTTPIEPRVSMPTSGDLSARSAASYLTKAEPNHFQTTSRSSYQAYSSESFTPRLTHRAVPLHTRTSTNHFATINSIVYRS